VLLPLPREESLSRRELPLRSSLLPDAKPRLLPEVEERLSLLLLPRELVLLREPPELPSREPVLLREPLE
jgi:hypothetical protein